MNWDIKFLSKCDGLDEKKNVGITYSKLRAQTIPLKLLDALKFKLQEFCMKRQTKLVKNQLKN